MNRQFLRKRILLESEGVVADLIDLFSELFCAFYLVIVLFLVILDLTLGLLKVILLLGEGCLLLDEFVAKAFNLNVILPLRPFNLRSCLPYLLLYPRLSLCDLAILFLDLQSEHLVPMLIHLVVTLRLFHISHINEVRRSGSRPSCSYG